MWVCRRGQEVHICWEHYQHTHYALLQNVIRNKAVTTVGHYNTWISVETTKFLQHVLTHLLAGMPCLFWCGHLQWRTQYCALHASTPPCTCAERHGTKRHAGPELGQFSSWWRMLPALSKANYKTKVFCFHSFIVLSFWYLKTCKNPESRSRKHLLHEHFYMVHTDQ